MIYDVTNMFLTLAFPCCASSNSYLLILFHCEAGDFTSEQPRGKYAAAFIFFFLPVFVFCPSCFSLIHPSWAFVFLHLFNDEEIRFRRFKILTHLSHSPPSFPLSCSPCFSFLSLRMQTRSHHCHFHSFFLNNCSHDFDII